MEFEYKKYKWFFTKSNKLVVGGKSASQNDDLIKSLKNDREDRIVMHTADPGSPFSVIFADINKVNKSDLEETAIFTASFSRAWRSGKSKAKVDIFNLSDMSKPSGTKVGTWVVKEKLSAKPVSLSLVLTKQKSTLRAVPPMTPKTKSSILLKIAPGKTPKEKQIDALSSQLKDKFTKEEILSAIPAGGLAIQGK
ncbi:hypothetical protein CMI47_11645 [Candidatus Pacearchaeota archaeon]|nr:hypothetical protein [Candidatus Pacearchaeota archaeon]|tara:strand:- start:11666 stop:12250 length:585 start_codon:yes stop_codon:yes gene_type:complete